MNRRDIIKAAAFAATAAGIAPARAQTGYPDRPVRLIVPFPPGGVVDVVARHWADRMKTVLGSVVVENQGGGGGIIGASSVVRAQPDGYSLLFGDTSALIISPSLASPPPYDAQNDFAAAAMVATSSTSIVVHPSVPATTLAAFIPYAKRLGGELSYASAGIGTVSHLAGELFKQLIGAPDIVHVPYRGSGPGLTDLLGGTVKVMTPNVTGQVLDFHRAGKLRILATCSPQRLKASPDIPAANESLEKLVVQLSCGVVAPARTPPAIVQKLAEATAAALRDPTFVTVLEAAGLEPHRDNSPEAAREFLRAETARLVPVIRAANIKS